MNNNEVVLRSIKKILDDTLLPYLKSAFASDRHYFDADIEHKVFLRPVLNTEKLKIAVVQKSDTEYLLGLDLREGALSVTYDLSNSGIAKELEYGVFKENVEFGSEVYSWVKGTWIFPLVGVSFPNRLYLYFGPTTIYQHYSNRSYYSTYSFESLYGACLTGSMVTSVQSVLKDLVSTDDIGGLKWERFKYKIKNSHYVEPVWRDFSVG